MGWRGGGEYCVSSRLFHGNMEVEVIGDLEEVWSGEGGEGVMEEEGNEEIEKEDSGGKKMGIGEVIDGQGMTEGGPEGGKGCWVCEFSDGDMRLHVFKEYLPWFISPDSTCWSCERQFLYPINE